MGLNLVGALLDLQLLVFVLVGCGSSFAVVVVGCESVVSSSFLLVFLDLSFYYLVVLDLMLEWLWFYYNGGGGGFAVSFLGYYVKLEYNFYLV